MPQGVTRIQDVIVPEIFNPYVQTLTKERSAIIQSGAMVADADLSNLLSGGGLTFNQPFWQDLSREDEENISNDNPSDKSTPNKIGAGKEIQVRLSRNNSWSTMDLTGTLAGSDPMQAIAARVAAYWTQRLQRAFIAAQKGVFAMNDAAPAGGSTHTQGDMTFDASGTSFVDGVTNFSAENFLDATQTMGDGQQDLRLVVMHSVVYNRAKKNNLIDFVPDAINGNAAEVPYFLGKRVIVDDGMPNNSGVFETWIYGAGAWRFGQGNAPVPTEVQRDPSAGKGGGQDILFNRVEWCLHPVGHAYVGQGYGGGGPTNAATSGNLAAATSWSRVFPERKQIQIARLLTREY